MIDDYRKTINYAIDRFEMNKNQELKKKWEERLSRFNNIIQAHDNKFSNNSNTQQASSISSNNNQTSNSKIKNNTKETELYRELSKSLSTIIPSNNENKVELKKKFSNFYNSGTDDQLNDIKDTLKGLIRSDHKFGNKLAYKLMDMPANSTIIDQINHDPSLRSEKDLDTFRNMFKDLGVYNKDDEDFMEDLESNIDYLRDDIKRSGNTALNMSDIGKSMEINKNAKDDSPEIEYTIKDKKLNSGTGKVFSDNNEEPPVSKEEAKNVMKSQHPSTNNSASEKNPEPSPSTSKEEEPVSKEKAKEVIKGDQTNKPKLINSKTYGERTNFYNDLSPEEQDEIINRNYTKDELKHILNTNPKKFKFIRSHNDNVTDKELDRIAFEFRRDMGIHGKYSDKKVKKFEDLAAYKLSVTNLVTQDEKRKLQDKNTDKIKLMRGIYDRLNREGNTKAIKSFSKAVVKNGYSFGRNPSMDNDDHPSILTYRDLNAYKKAMENIGVVDKDTLEKELSKNIRGNRISGERTDKGVRVLSVVDNLIKDSKESGKPIRGIAKNLLDKLEQSIDNSSDGNENYKNGLRAAIKSYRGEIESLTGKQKEEVKNVLKGDTSKSTPPPVKQVIAQQTNNASDNQNNKNHTITPPSTENISSNSSSVPSKNEVKKVISSNSNKPSLPSTNTNTQNSSTQKSISNNINTNSNDKPSQKEVKQVIKGNNPKPVLPNNPQSNPVNNNTTKSTVEKQQSSNPSKSEVKTVLKGTTQHPELPSTKSTKTKDISSNNTNNSDTKTTDKNKSISNDNTDSKPEDKDNKPNNISSDSKETVIKTGQAIDNGKKEGDETTPKTTNNPKEENKTDKAETKNDSSSKDKEDTNKDSKKEENKETKNDSSAEPVATSQSSGSSSSSGGSGGGGGSYGGGGSSSKKKGSKQEQPKTEEPKDQSFLEKVKRALINKPREFIAKMAAKLRSLYSNWMNKAKEEENQGKAAWYKKIALKIMKAIDYVMEKLSNYKTQ